MKHRVKDLFLLTRSTLAMVAGGTPPGAWAQDPPLDPRSFEALPRLSARAIFSCQGLTVAAVLTCALLAGQPLAAQGDHAVALVADADAYLRQGHPNRNQGSESYLRIRSSGKNRALVHFDQERIEAIGASGSLVTAQLELYIESNADNWTPDGGEVA
ncbi:MAG: hypothetical protein GY856_06825, partial [bacterium]|nr:hypothetical protein [bacterium]